MPSAAPRMQIDGEALMIYAAKNEKKKLRKKRKNKSAVRRKETSCVYATSILVTVSIVCLVLIPVAYILHTCTNIKLENNGEGGSINNLSAVRRLAVGGGATELADICHQLENAEEEDNFIGFLRNLFQVHANESAIQTEANVSMSECFETQKELSICHREEAEKQKLLKESEKTIDDLLMEKEGLGAKAWNSSSTVTEKRTAASIEEELKVWENFRRSCELELLVIRRAYTEKFERAVQASKRLSQSVKIENKYRCDMAYYAANPHSRRLCSHMDELTIVAQRALARVVGAYQYTPDTSSSPRMLHSSRGLYLFLDFVKNLRNILRHIETISTTIICQNRFLLGLQDDDAGFLSSLWSTAGTLRSVRTGSQQYLEIQASREAIMEQMTLTGRLHVVARELLNRSSFSLYNLLTLPEVRHVLRFIGPNTLNLIMRARALNVTAQNIGRFRTNFVDAAEEIQDFMRKLS